MPDRSISILVPKTFTVLSVTGALTLFSVLTDASRLHLAALPQVPSAEASVAAAHRFAGLAARWRADVEFSSSGSDMITHWAYLRIIGMGADAIAPILRDLEHAPDHWHVALEAITGVCPVPPEDEGDVVAIAARWIAWGRDVGYLPGLVAV
jgi:hypothetical protein